MPGPRQIADVPLTRKLSITINGQKQTQTVPIDQQEYNLLSDMRQQIQQLTARVAIPDPPTNLKATGQAFSNQIQFTRSGDADYHEVLSSLTPSLKDASVRVYDIGNTNAWVDNIGQSAITKYYWVRARKLTGASSLQIGPAKATTLASATAQAQPSPPPASNIVVMNAETGQLIPYTLAGPRNTGNI
jgi:hypothetical protein